MTAPSWRRFPELYLIILKMTHARHRKAAIGVSHDEVSTESHGAGIGPIPTLSMRQIFLL